MKFKGIAGIGLLILSLIMFLLAFRIGGLPPAITGIGFVLIGIVFLKEN